MREKESDRAREKEPNCPLSDAPPVSAQVLSGVSYIDKLKGGSASSSTRMQNLQRVFGTGHPLTWFWPRVSTPAGAGAVSNPLKKGM